MPLQPGERAPDLRLPSHAREMVSLEELRGKHTLVVLFFPLAFTSTCTEELCAVGADLGSYRGMDARVLAISVDSPYTLARYRAECGADFPFLSDFHREAAAAFGVLRDGTVGPGLRGVSDRAVFVIDRDGVVRYTWHATDLDLLPPFDEVKEAVRRAG
jgi:glutaredoxin-dependent peroxiredoxin